MKKSSLWGISLLIAVSATACGAANQEESGELNQTDIISEAESETDSQEAASHFVSENAEDDVIADEENLPEEMEEGEEAMLTYNDSAEVNPDAIPDTKVDFEALRNKNSEVCAYIVIPGTSIAEPICKRDDSNEYYLEHNSENAEDSKGCIFMDMGNETNFTDPVTCLYAKSGTEEPFGDLIGYLDTDFMDKNKFIYVYSDEFVNQYEVFAAYNSTDTERPLVKYNFYDYGEYQQYIDEIFSLRDMTAVIDSNLLEKTLSSWNIITLTGVDGDGSRQVVQAVFNGRTAIN